MKKGENYILDSAKFPLTYKPQSFSDLRESAIARPKGWFIFKIMTIVPNSERFVICHTYYLADSSQTQNLIHSKYIFDKKFNLLGVYYSHTDSSVNSGILPEEKWKVMFGK